MKHLALLAMLMTPLLAQQQPQPKALSTMEYSALTERVVQLMESVSIVIPDLPRAAAPLVDRMKNARTEMTFGATTPQAYRFNEQAKRFLTIADAMPRPYPFPEVGLKQFGELREAISQLEQHFEGLLQQQQAALRPADRDQLGRYAEQNSRINPPIASDPRVVFMGDSITDGWRLNEYFPGKDYVNRGISGQVTSQMLARMKADVIDIRPQAMVFLGGTNDIARGTPLNIIQNNITMICDLADKARIKVILASVLPVHDYNMGTNPSYQMSKTRPPDTIRNLNNWIRTFAENRRYTFLNYYDSMRDGAGLLRKDLAEDGLHPNANGYRLMAPLVQKAIADTVTPVGQALKTREAAPKTRGRRR